MSEVWLKIRPIASKTAESSFHDVAKVLRDRKIDLLVVSGPGDKIFGMLSELDSRVRVFADQGRMSHKQPLEI